MTYIIQNRIIRICENEKDYGGSTLPHAQLLSDRPLGATEPSPTITIFSKPS